MNVAPLSPRARFAVLLAGIGGIVLGNLGDAIGRTRAFGVSILFHSGYAGLGAFVKTQEPMQGFVAPRFFGWLPLHLP